MGWAFSMKPSLLLWGPTEKHCTVLSLYNAVNFTQNIINDTQQLTREGEIWGVFCEFKLWLIFYLSHCTAVCVINLSYHGILDRAITKPNYTYTICTICYMGTEKYHINTILRVTRHLSNVQVLCMMDWWLLKTLPDYDEVTHSLT